MNPSHTGTPNVLAAASPITTPADGRSQKYRYGTALVAHQAGRAARRFLMTRDRSVLEHLGVDVGCAAEAEVARCGVRLVALAAGNAVAPAVGRVAEVGAALLDPLRPGGRSGRIGATVISS